MTSRYVTMLLVIAGFALAPASIQASDDDDRPGVAIYPGPGDYESCDEFNCSWGQCDDNGCSVIFTYPRRYEVAPPRP
ncbi:MULTISPECIES: hypothetical protein [Citromicrobium]|uniref:hypothetical protein n=1 Tax=Citromicrobium TaxID=72173 RepID=UPI0006DB2A3D|nr:MULTISPECIES: hypothetical protein [Citromicrobium]ALG60654.1 hypothetical protein WG74_07280 [Citromicrobium sp. JL477]KPM19892.1 hypothetical protein VM77_05465 [Citromicrobium sp. JL31]KPM22847.1 hypothetical protein VO57_11415 [Citromicrobium sp. JL2201]